jgi:hypothetical protein
MSYYVVYYQLHKVEENENSPTSSYDGNSRKPRFDVSLMILNICWHSCSMLSIISGAHSRLFSWLLSRYSSWRPLMLFYFCVEFTMPRFDELWIFYAMTRRIIMLYASIYFPGDDSIRLRTFFGGLTDVPIRNFVFLLSYSNYSTNVGVY